MTIKKLREQLGISQVEFSKKYDIPIQTIRQWESNPGTTSYRKCPDYIVSLISRLISADITISMLADLTENSPLDIKEVAKGVFG